MHKRTEIRNALVSLLTGTNPAYATAAGKHVYSNRVYNMSEEKLPAINVYDEAESASARTINARQYIKKITMKIDIRVEATASYDTILDNVCEQVEALMVSNGTLSGKCSSAVYLATELKFDISGTKTVGLATLTYEIQYLT